MSDSEKDKSVEEVEEQEEKKETKKRKKSSPKTDGSVSSTMKNWAKLNRTLEFANTINVVLF